MANTSENPEAYVLRDIVNEHMKEQRRARRWKVFFRLVLAAYAGVFFVMMFKDTSPKSMLESQKHVAVVDVKGEISSASRQGASAEHMIKGLRAAFEAENSVAVMVRLNSPGGSPVQSAQVYREINRLKEKHGKPVYAVAEDMAASGAYYIAAAADKIYADPSSLVGSIGVIMGGFGFSGTMDMLGVERRVYTSGEHKAFMDPYSEENPETIKHAYHLLDGIYEEFVSDVRKGRGDRIQGTNEELFNGLIWTGTQAMELGLVDGLGSVEEIALNEFDTEKVVSYSHTGNPLERLAQRLSASMAQEFSTFFSGSVQLR